VPCDCEQRGPELAASVRNAAALWVSSGKVLGYVEGVRWAAQALEQALPALAAELVKLERPSRKAARVRQGLEQFVGQLRSAAESRAQEGQNFERAALAMVAELARRKPSRVRGLRVAIANWLRGAP